MTSFAPSGRIAQWRGETLAGGGAKCKLKFAVRCNPARELFKFAGETFQPVRCSLCAGLGRDGARGRARPLRAAPGARYFLAGVAGDFLVGS